MKTEFLIPFEIDTSAIEQKLESDAYDEVVSDVLKDIRAREKED